MGCSCSSGALGTAEPKKAKTSSSQDPGISSESKPVTVIDSSTKKSKGSDPEDGNSFVIKDFQHPEGHREVPKINASVAESSIQARRSRSKESTGSRDSNKQAQDQEAAKASPARGSPGALGTLGGS
eukprot:gnl/TRDRNA2_/TRDRNA2_71298_c0_seq1.p2 gnl/TRDRNA2_/TRDRNA2_71298_c0~~gnl/TRDRNA2_/TRDRNA2_71298_c0_seq1.p2  ORF type:complete len:127 (+),score=12.79 gnl/TRDRNA2_/TRDRNA2_71298_c0_seq1:101-481(+)